jgi:ribosomal protein L11 methyltransferase
MAEMISSQLWELGCDGIAELAGGDDGCVLVAGFTDVTTARSAARAVAALHGPATGAVTGAGAAIGPGAGAARLTIGVEPADESAWIEALPTAVVDLPGGPVVIEVGPAFGHGRHPTTALALGLVGELTSPGAAVLDVGTGTGILTLAALAAGADRVSAVDTDPAALAVAEANLTAHRHLGPTATIGLTTDLTTETGPFDLVVANLLAPTHQALAPDIDRRLAPGGRVVLSGLLEEQAAEVVASHRDLVESQRRRWDDWVALVLAPPTSR